jgi:WS/DGAT/MGAT family acyltransferase
MLKQLSGLDSMFLYLDKTRTPLEVSSVHIYDPSTAPGGQVDFEDILATFESRLDRSSVFRRKLLEPPLALDHPYWVEDPDFDIEYHVRHIALPKPGDWRQLMIQISRLQSQHLDKTRPLWEAYVIEGLDNIDGLNPGCFAIFMKMHHATVDGTSGIEIQKAIHDLEPVVEKPGSHGSKVLPAGIEAPGALGLLARSPLSYARGSIRLLFGLASAAPGLVRAALRTRNRPRTKVPRSIFNVGRASANRVIDARFYDLGDVKAIARAAGDLTVNDVAMAIIGGAMRRYLGARGHLPEKSLVTACPIDVRREHDTDQTYDNMVGVMSVSLHTDEADPVARIKAIHESAVQAKATTDLVGAGTATELPMNLPAPISRTLLPALVELLGRSGLTPFNTLITNVPGVQRPMYLGGAKMVSLIGIIPVVDQMGLTHAVFSYNGVLSISFTACREMLPDPAAYAQCIEDSYRELAHLLGPKTARVASGAREGAHSPATGKSSRSGKRPLKKKARIRKRSAKAAAKPERAQTRAPLAPEKRGARKKALKKKALKKKALRKKTVRRPVPSRSSPERSKAVQRTSSGKKVLKKKALKKKALRKKPLSKTSRTRGD